MRTCIPLVQQPAILIHSLSLSAATIVCIRSGLLSQYSLYEGMAVFRHPNGTYYMITSHLTG